MTQRLKQWSGGDISLTLSTNPPTPSPTFCQYIDWCGAFLSVLAACFPTVLTVTQLKTVCALPQIALAGTWKSRWNGHLKADLSTHTFNFTFAFEPAACSPVALHVRRHRARPPGVKCNYWKRHEPKRELMRPAHPVAPSNPSLLSSPDRIFTSSRYFLSMCNMTTQSRTWASKNCSPVFDLHLCTSHMFSGVHFILNGKSCDVKANKSDESIHP